MIFIPFNLRRIVPAIVQVLKTPDGSQCILTRAISKGVSFMASFMVALKTYSAIHASDRDPVFNYVCLALSIYPNMG
jgi:hypothetical protein